MRKLVLAAVLLAFGAGCTPSRHGDMRADLGAVGEEPADGGPPSNIGGTCFIPSADQPGDERVFAPAIECSSRLCLHYPGGVTSWDEPAPTALCTAECESDWDCDPTPETPCAGADMVCEVATTTGPWAGKRLCICEDGDLRW